MPVRADVERGPRRCTCALFPGSVCSGILSPEWRGAAVLRRSTVVGAYSGSAVHPMKQAGIDAQVLSLSFSVRSTEIGRSELAPVGLCGEEIGMARKGGACVARVLDPWSAQARGRLSSTRSHTGASPSAVRPPMRDCSRDLWRALQRMLTSLLEDRGALARRK